jgi:hypothetical protein
MHLGQGVVVNMFYNRGKLVPERPCHSVHGFGTFQLNVRDASLDLDLETAIVHLFVDAHAVLPYR